LNALVAVISQKIISAMWTGWYGKKSSCGSHPTSTQTAANA